VLDYYHEVVAVDSEHIASPGNRSTPVCLVGHELRSGRRFRVWQDQFGPAPPYATGPDVQLGHPPSLLTLSPTADAVGKLRNERGLARLATHSLVTRRSETLSTS
jgi:hypothetical protein